MRERPIRWIKRLLSLGCVGLALSLFVWPSAMVLEAVFDAELATSRPSARVFAWHRALAPAYAEWPLYGSVFFLRATENLQNAWQQEPRGDEPRLYAADAIAAAADLMVDPQHASWVQQHWGADYGSRENLFYRMLVIDGLSSFQTLSGSTRHADLLRTYTKSLAQDLVDSPDGLLDDYPGQCYPVDVVSAWRAIQRSDQLLDLGLEHTIQLGLRGFVAARSSPQGLPPYFLDRTDPVPTGISRGSSNSGLMLAAPWLWPEQSKQWYQAYAAEYWSRGWLLAGFREFPRAHGVAFYADVDSGPVIAGLGTAASALGVSASRSMGRFDHARPLALEMIAASWPLPNGRLLIPSFVSDREHAPHIGEAAILFALSQPVAPGMSSTAGGRTPGLVVLILIFQVTVTMLLLKLSHRIW